MPFLELKENNDRIVEMYYETYGNGTPILLIHGWLCNSTFWEDFKKLADSKKYMLIIPDLRGHGETKNAGDSSIDRMAEDMKCLLDFLNIQKAIVIGHSMGGLVTQMLYKKYPTRFIAMGLWNTGAKIPLGYGIGTTFYVGRIAAFITGLIVSYPIPPLFRFVLAQGWKLAFKKKGKSEAYLRYVPSVKRLKPKAVLKAAFALAGFNGKKELPNINVPVMLLHGKYDRNITPVQLFEYLKKNIPEYIAYESETSAHFPPNENFDEIYGYLIDFLEFLEKKRVL